jgi:peptide/nickel transport system ATP-binding protein
LPATAKPGTDLNQIPGGAPSLLDLPAGCPFRPRCDRATDACRADPPMTLSGLRGYRCHHPIDAAAAA